MSDDFDGRIKIKSSYDLVLFVMIFLCLFFTWGMRFRLSLDGNDEFCSSMQLCGGRASEGVFVGAFLSMSSTAVVSLVLKSLVEHFLLPCSNKIFTHLWPTCRYTSF